MQLSLKGIRARGKKMKGGLKLEARHVVKLRSAMAMLIKTPGEKEGGND